MSAAAYHAGMRPAERDDVQERFMDGDLDVVVATTAFGMGIDKANVRWVFNAEISESLDAYYQEIGRAGRDGEPAEAVLFYRAEDVGLRRFFAGTGQVEVDEIAGVLDAIEHHDGPVDPAELQEETELSQTKLTTAVARLEEAGALEVLPTGEVALKPAGPAHSAAIRAAAEAAEKRRSLERSRVDMMRAYAEAWFCRRAQILSYFGEPFTPPCGHCDNCEAGHGVPDAPRRRAVRDRRARRASELGRGRRAALRRPRRRRAVRRGRLQVARARRDRRARDLLTRRPERRRGEHLARDLARGVGPRQPACGGRHRLAARRVLGDRVDGGPEPLRRQLLVADHHRRPGVAPSSGRCRSGGRRTRAGRG